MTIFSKHFEGNGPFAPPWLRLCAVPFESHTFMTYQTFRHWLDLNGKKFCSPRLCCPFVPRCPVYFSSIYSSSRKGWHFHCFAEFLKLLQINVQQAAVRHCRFTVTPLTGWFSSKPLSRSHNNAVNVLQRAKWKCVSNAPQQRPGARTRNPSKFGWTEPKTFRCWSRSRSLKLGSGFTALVCGANELYTELSPESIQWGLYTCAWGLDILKQWFPNCGTHTLRFYTKRIQLVFWLNACC